jgi:hypothetical protein
LEEIAGSLAIWRESDKDDFEAGIQKQLIFWIPARASFRQLARNDN